MNESWFNDLNTKTIGCKVRCLPKTTSTNDLAWLEISRGAQEGMVIFAEEQLKGRGRLDRKWFSPAGKSLLASIILKPKLSAENMPLLMCFSSIALCELIKNEFFLSALIRWPNDIMINNKKIGGIIVESRFSGKSPEAAVIGIGLNINIANHEIPSELKGKMTSLLIEKGETIDRQELARLFLCYLDLWYQKLTNQDYATIDSVWRRLSSVLNNKVVIKQEDKTFTGKVIGLDPCKGITLKSDSNETKVFRGECVESLRLI